MKSLILSVMLLVLSGCATLQDKENQEAVSQGVTTFLIGFIK